MRQRALPRNHGPRVVDDAIRRRLRRLRQGSQEIAHLPTDAAAVLEAAGTKHENIDRRRPRPVVGIPGRPIAWSTGLRMTPRRSYMLHMYNPMRAAKRKSGPVAASCNCQTATRPDPSGRMARPEKSLQALEKAKMGPDMAGRASPQRSAALAVAVTLSCEACRILVCCPDPRDPQCSHTVHTERL